MRSPVVLWVARQAAPVVRRLGPELAELGLALVSGDELRIKLARVDMESALDDLGRRAIRGEL